MLNIIRLTPTGRGAVGSFLFCGEGAADIFLSRWRGKEPVLRQPAWGKISLDDINSSEEAVVCRVADDAFEIHTHGGDQVASVVETLFMQSGAVRKTWQEYYAGGTSQQDRALRLLPFASTERTAQILLDQYHGAWDREMSALKLLSDGEEKQIQQDRFAKLSELGRHLTEPFRVVLAGASNAGKSSLLNAVLGFQRSLVHDRAGTTRDVVSGQTALEGFPVAFFDTAGFRQTNDDLERQGMNRSLQSLSEADLVVWVIDLTAGESQRPECPEVPHLIHCYNKCDLIPPPPLSDSSAAVSALQGDGIEQLLDMIFRHLVPLPPLPGDAVWLREKSSKRGDIV